MIACADFNYFKCRKIPSGPNGENNEKKTVERKHIL
jgi:hypothetical protein